MENGIAGLKTCGEPPKNEILTDELKNLAVEKPSTISFKYLSPTVAVIVTSVPSKVGTNCCNSLKGYLNLYTP